MTSKYIKYIAQVDLCDPLGTLLLLDMYNSILNPSQMIIDRQCENSEKKKILMHHTYIYSHVFEQRH